VAIGSSAEQGSSIRMTSGFDRDGAGDAEALLLAAGEAGAGLDAGGPSPRPTGRRLRSARLDDLVELRP